MIFFCSIFFVGIHVKLESIQIGKLFVKLCVEMSQNLFWSTFMVEQVLSRWFERFCRLNFVFKNVGTWCSKNLGNQEKIFLSNRLNASLHNPFHLLFDSKNFDYHLKLIFFHLNLIETPWSVHKIFHIKKFAFHSLNFTKFSPSKNFSSKLKKHLKYLPFNWKKNPHKIFKNKFIIRNGKKQIR